MVALTAVAALGSATLAPAVAQVAPDAVELQIIAINDFHGHLDPRTGGAPSVAGVLGGAVAAARAANPNTVFVSAGDNIGASPFISSSQLDAPTLDVLDQMGLAVSAVGNHEFDRGYADLAGRVTARADFPHLGANVLGESPELPEHHVVTTPSGVRIGFVGVVTQATASLVSPAGIAGITFGDPVAAADRVAAQLSDGVAENGEADVVVLLAHEGSDVAAPPADCASLASADNTFGRIISQTSADVDVIFGGHTHLRVDCEFALPGGQVRPVLEAGQYGEAFSRLRLTWSPSERRVTAVDGQVLGLTATSYPADPAVEALVREADAAADAIGRQVIGRITADIPRARTAGGAEDRGSESLLGNFIADVQRSAVPGTQIAFMNPGGLRDDLLLDDVDGDEARGEVTYAEAAVVQPFANTLYTLTLTGAQVKQVLEEQYQPAGSTRPFLALGVSRGLRYGFDDTAPRGSRIHSITLDGAPLDPAASYRVVTNSFLAFGGDNFTTLGRGSDRRDTGLDDLSVLVRHFQANSPVTPDTTDRAVPGRAPSTPTGPGTTPPPATPGGPPVPQAPAAAALTRLAGENRYATAAAVVRSAFPSAPVPVVVIASGEAYADALAAGPVADRLGGPVLPVPTVGLPSDVRAELTRLRPGRIVVLGGPEAVSEATVTALGAFTAGPVTRLAGADRFATAAAAATETFSSPVPRVLVATGNDFADALSGGAAGARTDSPVLLSFKSTLPEATAAALRRLQPRDITVLGGPNAVSDAVLEQLRAFAVGGTVDRIAGADRYDTAARVASAFWPPSTPVVYLATGRRFVDALAGVPSAGRDAAPVLLVEPTCMPAATRRELDRLSPARVVVLGGDAAIGAGAVARRAC